MSNKKATILVPQIIAARTNEEAIEVLKNTLKVLNLSADYVDLNNTKYILDDFSNQFKEISNRYKELSSPKSFNDIQEIRIDLNFLFRDIVDALSFSINQNKIYFEEQKSVVRAESMLHIADDEIIQGKVKAKSTGSLRDIYGAAEGTKEYVNLAAISYGLYKGLETLLNSIRMLTDSLASESKYLLSVEVKDAK